MPYRLENGDLLHATTQYIVQQNCCTGIKAHGLSEIISKKWSDINPYKERRCYKGSWAIKEDRPQPGDICVYDFDNPLSTGLRGVICMFAQYCHGKCRKYKDPLGLDDKFGDDPIDRIRYFSQCLELIASLEPRPQSIGFPWRIGCGLAGGVWSHYEQIIRKWSKTNDDIDVVIYKLD
jgi:hypothetical protein